MRNFFVILLFSILTVGSIANAATPIKSDSRIKTLVYNENEVFTLAARTGFQSSIEFAKNEVIETISIGDPIGWQVTPAGSRVFIKPLHKSGVTNLSVITNKRSYQFELTASTSGRSHSYVIKFYYPESGIAGFGNFQDRTRGDTRPVSATYVPEVPIAPPPPAPILAPPPPAPRQMPTPSGQPETTGLNLYNFNYTLTGAGDSAPNKIFDDGRSTYFEFGPSTKAVPKFSIVNPDGSETPIPARVEGGLPNGKIVVDRVAGKLTIRNNGKEICVFNEEILSLPSTNSITSAGAR